jgi:hypothetical protein
MVFDGLYSNTKARKLAALANEQKYVILSHGKDSGTNFMLRQGSAVIFVPPQYALLSKKFALNTVNRFNLFKDNNKLKKFMKFEYPEDMYITKTGNNTHFMQIFVGGQYVPDLDMLFTNSNKIINNKVGVWKLPVNSRNSNPVKPRNGIDKLSQIVNSVPGVYFVFACRSQVCPRGISKILQMTGGGVTNARVVNRPLVGANRFHFNNIGTALNNINTSNNNKKTRVTRSTFPIVGGVRKPKKMDKLRMNDYIKRRAAMTRRRNLRKIAGYNGNTSNGNGNRPLKRSRTNNNNSNGNRPHKRIRTNNNTSNGNRPPKRSRTNNNTSNGNRPPKRSRVNNNSNGNRPLKRSRVNNNGTITANLMRVMKEPPTKQRYNKIMTLLARMPNNGTTTNLLSKKSIPEFRG